jgi:hypothetical protein
MLETDYDKYKGNFFIRIFFLLFPISYDFDFVTWDGRTWCTIGPSAKEDKIPINIWILKFDIPIKPVIHLMYSVSFCVIFAFVIYFGPTLWYYIKLLYFWTPLPGYVSYWFCVWPVLCLAAVYDYFIIY